MHFSSPSGQRLSWWRPWKRGAVGSFCSGYWTVSTFLNICRKVTPKPLTGPRKSATGHLLCLVVGHPGQHWLTRGNADAVVVREVHGWRGKRWLGLGFAACRDARVLGLRCQPLGSLARRLPAPQERQQNHDNPAADEV